MSTFALIGSLAGGVGLFLLGMGLMTDGLKLNAGPSLERILANSTKTRVRGLASGILVTALVKSSSAVTAAAIGLVNAGLLNLSQAVRVLFGANLGTTVRALFAALCATPNAKRAAAAHISFNLLTGVVALLLLPWLISFLAELREWLELDLAPAAKLALFHTVFNVLGVILIWPVAARMMQFLQASFKSADEDERRLHHLDKTVLAVPALALDALERQVRRMGSIAMTMVRAVAAKSSGHNVAREKAIVARLNLAITDFIVQINRAGMPPERAQRLPEILGLAPRSICR